MKEIHNSMGGILRPVEVETYQQVDKLGGHPGEKVGSWVKNGGLFHEWAHELDTNGSVYSVGLVELDTGRIVTVLPEKVRFLDRVR
jgi:hypothetical protein